MSYGCKNRKPFVDVYFVQDGQRLRGKTLVPNLIPIHNRMSKDCQYTIHDTYADPECVGCKWRKHEES